jgi:hypothetical protein
VRRYQYQSCCCCVCQENSYCPLGAYWRFLKRRRPRFVCNLHDTREGTRVKKSPFHIFPASRLATVSCATDALRNVTEITMLLSGWKDIANHVQKGVRTVQRWESLGLPITRITKSVRSPVIAFSDEVDRWHRRLSSRHSELLIPPASGPTRIAQLHKQAEALRRRSAELIRAAEQIAIRRASLLASRPVASIPSLAFLDASS